ncbi:hypothetical protein FDP41_003920 [Naegleria fowleri]|uniref:Mis18 domain-containing protein n=1 Tax=Naegleria fowleri TaxID=5763 RepID=A0A6A5BJT0_NAEFO|nr:uncharacterized protein FDP41_003920 [Naegleria fowleri]KAF0977267.1 hypothetical protein FDP41_003920 [Naegleria fowleri]CAG4715843.1 unnamed protein product [Naegleria fowleri]
MFQNHITPPSSSSVGVHQAPPPHHQLMNDPLNSTSMLNNNNNTNNNIHTLPTNPGGIVVPVPTRHSAYQTPLQPTTPKNPGSASSNVVLTTPVESSTANTPPFNNQVHGDGMVVGERDQHGDHHHLQQKTPNFPYFSSSASVQHVLTTDNNPQQPPYSSGVLTAAIVQPPQTSYGVNNPTTLGGEPVTNNAPPVLEKTTSTSDSQFVFSCKHCRTIFIDSNALVYHSDENEILSFCSIYKVDVRENVQIAPPDRFDAGSNYYPLFCRHCQSCVGRKYIMSDKSPIVDILHFYTLDFHCLSVYELWSADSEKTPGEEGNITEPAALFKELPTLKSINDEIGFIHSSLLGLKEKDDKIFSRIDALETNTQIIPQLKQKIEELEKTLNTIKETQTKLTHKHRQLGHEVVHIKKETGVVPLYDLQPTNSPKIITTNEANIENNKKRTSIGGTSSNLPESLSKKKKN